MTTPNSKEQRYFTLAFDLAYSIHVNKEVAFFVAEDALDGLASMLGHHEKNRKPSERLRGFLKSGERTRPVRKMIRLSEAQMLQWLVYKQSESWERLTESGRGLYLPTEEDLIVRYLEYLIFVTLRRGSFYVTLAVGPLLHQFGRRETRLFYDILTQSDSARMKDTNYIGKQRLEMLDKVSRRFGDAIQTVAKPGEEKQFVMRPTTPWVVHLVGEILRLLTPWDSACVVKPGFDVTDIPGLYFSETGAQDEELIEMNRLHTVVDPVCFATFAEGLSRYVRTLPNEDQDKACKYDCLDERLRIPKFSNFTSGTSRGDRFQPPKLTAEDYIRLQRTLEARAHRRKAFVPQQLSIYIDEVLSYSFDPSTQTRARFLIGPEGGLTIEVRGRDVIGELTLATLLLDDHPFSAAQFGETVVDAGGPRVSIWLTPLRDASSALTGMQLEVSYQHAHLRPPVSQLIRLAWLGLTGMTRGDGSVRAGLKPRQSPRRSQWVRVGAAVMFVMMTTTFIWWQFRSRSPESGAAWPQQTAQQGEEPIKEKGPSTASSPSPIPRQSPALREVKPLVARADWSREREAALRAIPLEPTRSEMQVVDLSRDEIKVVLSVPLYDDHGLPYSRYRLTLATTQARLWQETLHAPKGSSTGYARILDLLLYTRRLPETGRYDLGVEGSINDGWLPLGKIRFKPKER